MENATKALIIAASVLIVIVLIAIGIKLLGSSQGVTNEVGEVSDAMGKSTFNSQFTDYVGVQLGTQVKTVLSKAAATYRRDSSREVFVSVTGGAGLTSGTYDTANEIASVMSSLRANSSYTVGVTYDLNGYVNSITIR